MYLSRVKLEPWNRKAAAALDNPWVMHGIVKCALSGSKDHPLWRVDELEGNRYLLLMSSEKPDKDVLTSQLSSEGGVFTKDYGAFLNRIDMGQRYFFRLAGNPVKRSKESGRIVPLAKMSEKRPGYRTEEGWIEERGSACGFRTEYMKITARGTKHFFKKEHTTGKKRAVTIHCVTYEGILEVTDNRSFTRH